MDLRGVTSHLAHENRSSVTVAREVLAYDEAELPLGLRKIHFHSADVTREPAAPRPAPGRPGPPWKASSLQILLFACLRATQECCVLFYFFF